MTENLLKSILGTAIVLFFSSCDEILNVEIIGDGNIKTETREFGSFEELSLNADFKLSLTNGSPSVEVVADSNLLTYIETEIVGSELQVSVKPNFQIVPRQPVRIYVSVDDRFSGVEITDGGTVIADSLWTQKLNLAVYGVSNFVGDTLGAQALNVFSEGSTNIDIKGSFDDLSIRQIGSGNIFLEGYSEFGSIILEGSGKIDSQHLTIGNGKIKLYGSGLVLCRIIGTLTAEIEGNGRIYYYGIPTNLIKKIEGEGLVLPADD
ncbi:GIN domain-containing protein [Marinilabilia rubra]|uniref:DUF2807 domain-containing protein n=1 Tax=Marinilabilia rubra TaxID=2162893 RepID=A0A2U2B4A0_9BACT|nr:DUF2807 domain-containing protein [Marinilabilia rubra]PWD97901.1 DUF2807 domain-containing protein [Marinilabilia rubra]